jgi:hypothetical protein
MDGFENAGVNTEGVAEPQENIDSSQAEDTAGAEGTEGQEEQQQSQEESQQQSFKDNPQNRAFADMRRRMFQP